MSWSVIKNEHEYEVAIKRLEVIFDSAPEDSTFAEAELLVLLIENYELESEPGFPDADPIAIIKEKMAERDMVSKDLGLIIGGKSKASEILNKKRRLTLRMIRQINKMLGIPAEVLISEYDLVK